MRVETDDGVLDRMSQPRLVETSLLCILRAGSFLGRLVRLESSVGPLRRRIILNGDPVRSYDCLHRWSLARQMGEEISGRGRMNSKILIERIA